jgi:RHS repeat-associated protein
MFDRLAPKTRIAAVCCALGAVLALLLVAGMAAGSLAVGHPARLVSRAGGGVRREMRGGGEAAWLRRERSAVVLRRKRWLARPAMREQRLSSQMAFHGLGAVASRRLLMRDYGRMLAAIGADPVAAMEKSGRIVRYQSASSAVVRTPRGLRVETSSVPLQVAGPAGKERPVDLRLDASGGELVPAAPLVATSIARNSGGGVAVGSEGLRLTLLGDHVPGNVMGGRDVVFGDVGRDMDAVVAPELHGADLSALLRSRLSSEHLRYRVRLPAGAGLQASDGGAVVSRGGRTLARILAPSARDAQGTAVPVHMAVFGDDLVLTVPRRGKSLAYPVLVDPKVEVNLVQTPGIWTFEAEVGGTNECEGEPSGVGTYPCGGQHMFTHGGGGAEPFAITLPSVAVPYTVTQWNPILEREEEVVVEGGKAEWWWRPSGTEGITSVEFSDITSSGTGDVEGEPSVQFSVAACHEEHGWYTTESPPASVRFVPAEGHSCNSTKKEVVKIWIASGVKREAEPTTVAGSISVGDVLVTRTMTKGEEEEQEQELFGEGSEVAPDRTECFKGYPVNCASGNQVETQTDFSVGGRGLGLHLTRTYNSRLAAKQGEHERGPFGFGWTGPYTAHLVEKVQGGFDYATVTQDNGSTVRFKRFAGGPWKALGSLVEATLVESGEEEYTYTLPDQTVLHFNRVGQLTSEADRNGNALTMTYGPKYLEAVTDSSGRKITFAYNAEGEVESAKDPMGHTVKYVYESGQLKSVTQPGELALRWQFKYNAEHELTSETDGRSNVTTTEYNGSRRVIEQKDPLGRTRKWEYLFIGGEQVETAVTELNGSVTRIIFNSSSLPTSSTQAAGTPIAATTFNEYNGVGELVAATDPNKHKTEYGYDSEGDRTSEKDADGDETKWTYDSEHDVETKTTPDGEMTTIKRGAHGNAESVSREAPGSKTQVTKYKYDASGDLESVTNPLEHTWTYEYDSYGDRKAEVDPEGNKRTWEYNEDSQETATVRPRGNVKGAEASKYTTKTERDNQGRPLAVIDSLGHKTKYKYDGDGNIETLTDPNSNVTKYTYDSDDELTKVEAPNKAIIETGYDSAGQITSQTSGKKNITKYVRNGLEEITEGLDPLSHKTIKEYDADGNLTKVTDAAKRVTIYTYDAANRLKEIVYSDGKTHAVEYEYNKDGDITTIKDGSGTTKYTYDQLDRPTEVENGHKEVIKREYDLANELTKLTYPSGKAVTRTYDKDGRLEKATDWLEHVTKFSYDPDSDQTAVIFAAGTEDEDKYSYNEAGQISEVKMMKAAETLASLAYTRDSDGQVKGVTSKGLPGEEKPADEYDANSRLKKAGTTSYEYDADSEPTKLGTGAYTYNKADELESGPSLKYTYNEVDQRTKTTPTTGPATTYGYDQAGNLITVERPKEGTTAKIEDAYGYNGNGLRISQTISGTTSYLAWDTTEEIPILLSDGTNSYIYGPGRVPIEQINNATGEVLYLHHDQAGSTRLLTGSTGKVEGAYTYGPYGEATGHTGTATTPLGYDGQYTSSDTGLIYMRARVYDPATTQFLTRDPLAAISGEPYSYAGDNPLNRSDPTGLLFGIELPSLEEIGEGIAGWGDTITFGGTEWVREQLGDNNIDACSGAYADGGYAGLVTGVLIPGEGEAEIGAEGLSVSAKIARQMEARGWTEEEIQQAIDSGEQVQAVNKATGDPATRYISPKTGQSVVVDNVTNEVIHVGGPGFKYGLGSGDLP